MKASLLLLMLSSIPGFAVAQEPRADVSVQVPVTRLREFDETSLGFGASFSYRLADWFAFEASAAHDPGDLGDPPFSRSRTEALFGARLGPHLERSGPFVAARGGVLDFGKAPEPIACIAIFPPPLSCILAGGETAGAVSLAAGWQVTQGERTVFRIEAGDLMVRYPGPSFSEGDGREAHEGDFWSHNLRFAVSAGFRF